VAQLKKQLVTLKATQTKLQKAFLAAKTKAAKNSLAKRIAVVKASQAKINLQLKLLKQVTRIGSPPCSFSGRATSG
jgi:hypothetical protein